MLRYIEIYLLDVPPIKRSSMFCFIQGAYRDHFLQGEDDVSQKISRFMTHHINCVDKFPDDFQSIYRQVSSFLT